MVYIQGISRTPALDHLDLTALLNKHPTSPLKAALGAAIALAVCLLAAVADELGTQKLFERIQKTHGPAARGRVEGWLKLIAENPSKTDQEKLEIANRYFNQLDFVEDAEHWGKEDYWATPMEMLVSNGGDCEDFSIAKYFTLRALRVPETRLRLTYVKSLQLNQAHMVLTYTTEAGAMPLVLDNLIPEIKPASQRPDLQPVYSFNVEGLWLAKQRGAGRHLGGAEHVDLWKDLLRRMKTQYDLDLN